MTVTEPNVWTPIAGIRFTDAATGLTVRDALRVSARIGAHDAHVRAVA